VTPGHEASERILRELAFSQLTDDDVSAGEAGKEIWLRPADVPLPGLPAVP
jgi:hypothetical protein